MSTQLDEAERLLEMDPPPADAAERLERLAAAAPASEARQFADLREGLHILLPLPDDPGLE